MLKDKIKNEILKFIDDLYFEHGTKDPIKICKFLDIPIKYADISMKGLTTVLLDSPLIIIQNSLEGFAKKFVVGHELYHVLKHDCQEITFFREHTGFKLNVYEEEANYFSTQLLIDYIDYAEDEIVDIEIAEEIGVYLSE